MGIGERHEGLFHYTCDDGAREIGDGPLKPNPQPALDGIALVWLTDLDVPNRYALGLTSDSLDCDRTKHRYEVKAPGAIPWSEFARSLPVPLRRRLEAAPGAMPRHWWVSLEHVDLESRR